LEFSPEVYRAYAGRAKANFQLGAFEHTVRDCDTLLAHDPESYVDYVLRAQALRRLGRTESAVADLRKALKIAREIGSPTDSLASAIRDLGYDPEQ
jgi:tetratricopeptide (TPR) repeat protein